MNGVPWTQKEITRLSEMHRNMPVSQISRVLGRTECSVRYKVNKLGLISPRQWTKKDEIYLQEKWGTVSMDNLCKHLGRTKSAVMIHASRLQLGPFLEAGEYISLNQLSIALGRGSTSNYQMISWVKNRQFPLKTKKVNTTTWRIVYLDEFWEWAEKNRTFIDFSKVEENILGKEPAWVKEQRKADVLKYIKYRTPKEPWSTAEDKCLIDYLQQYKYTYHELSQMLGRTCGAIQRRVCDLDIKERPVKADNHNKWTAEEFEQLSDMIKTGSSYELMAEILGRSSKALRGRVWQMYRTENLDNVISMIGAGSWGDGAPAPQVKHDFRRMPVKQDLTRLCQILLIHRNELDFDGYWQCDTFLNKLRATI